MAGDWIKMSTGLQKHPKVVRMASALQTDRFRIVGGLHSVWCLFDEYTTDGVLEGYSAQVVDELTGFAGLAQAMIDVKWLDASQPGFLVLPEFETHNGASAKRRALDADRKRKVRKESADDADKMRTRGEESRGDSKNPPKPPQGGEQAAPTAKPPKQKRTPKTHGQKLEAWLAEIAATGEKAIPADDPVFETARNAGIPALYVQIAWRVFKAYHLDRPEKKQIDWRATFRNYVRMNYLKLWVPAAAGGYELTKLGVQHQREMQGAGGE